MPLGLGPAVVAAGPVYVQLVPGVLLELAGEHRAGLGRGDALRIAVPESVPERAEERFVCGHGTLGGQAQDLPGKGAEILRALGPPLLAGGHAQRPA